MTVLSTQVLVVGAGPTGASAALFLARHKISVLLVARNRAVSDTPRAHITNSRTMEILRNVGLEEKCYAKASANSFQANKVWVTTLAGQELGRLMSWGNHPTRRAEYELASPGHMCDLPQWHLEPILLEEAKRLGVRIMFEHELMGFTQTENEVLSTVKDLAANKTLQIRSCYMVAGDGGRSTAVSQLGLPLEGEEGMGTAVNVLFEADLTPHVAHRPGSLYSVFDHGCDDITGGYTTLRMVRPWSQWVATFPEIGTRDGPVKVDETQARSVIVGMIGDPGIPITIKNISRWLVNRLVASKYSKGRVFCAGDAVHRHPPWNGLGSNTCIQDTFNLAWKIAMVLHGKAGQKLLETYSDERQPIGKLVVDRAFRSFEEGRALLEALEIRAGQSAAERRAAFERLADPGPDGEERRKRWRAAIENRNYVYNALGVELNQVYRSGAVVTDGSAQPVFSTDPELYYNATTWPGARLPHCWLEQDRRALSVQDLCGHEGFSLLTGIGGAAWKDAAKRASNVTGVPIRVEEIGLGLPVLDPYGDWARLSEVGESGCVLVRPDLHVGWRSMSASEASSDSLTVVFQRVLGR